MVIRTIKEKKPEFIVPVLKEMQQHSLQMFVGFLVKKSRKLYQKLKEWPKIMTKWEAERRDAWSSSEWLQHKETFRSIRFKKNSFGILFGSLPGSLSIGIRPSGDELCTTGDTTAERLYDIRMSLVTISFHSDTSVKLLKGKKIKTKITVKTHHNMD